ncbi:MAG: hypothetical protein CL927_01840 [Deltaproteobacteria bacterium]|nr:hypothetical protein [Deltaproteobacteria bacterium]
MRFRLLADLRTGEAPTNDCDAVLLDFERPIAGGMAHHRATAAPDLEPDETVCSGDYFVS